MHTFVAWRAVNSSYSHRYMRGRRRETRRKHLGKLLPAPQIEVVSFSPLSGKLKIMVAPTSGVTAEFSEMMCTYCSFQPKSTSKSH